LLLATDAAEELIDVVKDPERLFGHRSTVLLSLGAAVA
jgi:hypothetical protein